MVNNIGSTKKRILNLLRQSGQVTSGQVMSEKLNISRVAVWKHIKTLKELGYVITGSSAGYKLEEEKGFLYPWEFEKNSNLYLTYKNTTSTMDIAKEAAEKGCKKNTTVIAETQSAGKGRADRNWDSEEGGLYFTKVLNPLLPSAYLHIYTLAAAAVICVIIEELYNIKAKAKWPNDILVDGKKMAGILTESHIKGDRICWLNLGIGINVNNIPSVEGASSIKKISGRIHDRKELLLSFESKYSKLLKNNTPKQINKLWKNNNCTIGKDIDFISVTGEQYFGKAIDIDSSGSLLIKDKSKKIKQALFGDIYTKKIIAI